MNLLSGNSFEWETLKVLHLLTMTNVLGTYLCLSNSTFSQLHRLTVSLTNYPKVVRTPYQLKQFLGYPAAEKNLKKNV